MERTVYTSTHVWLRLEELERWHWVNDKGMPFRVDSIVLDVRDDQKLNNSRVLLRGQAIKTDGTVSAAYKREVAIPFLSLPERFRSQLVYELTQSSLRHSMGRTL